MAINGQVLAESELEHTLTVYLCATQTRLGVCSMGVQLNIGTESCPPTEESVVAETRKLFEELVGFCQAEEWTFWEFEKRFLVLLFGLGRVLTRLMLVNRHLRLDLKPYQALTGYRLGDGYAERKLKTVFGEITYGRVAFPAGGRRDGVSSVGRGLGTNSGRILPMGGAARDAVGDADEFRGQSADLQGGAGMVALDRDD